MLCGIDRINTRNRIPNGLLGSTCLRWVAASNDRQTSMIGREHAPNMCIKPNGNVERGTTPARPGKRQNNDVPAAAMVGDCSRTKQTFHQTTHPQTCLSIHPQYVSSRGNICLRPPTAIENLRQAHANLYRTPPPRCHVGRVVAAHRARPYCGRTGTRTILWGPYIIWRSCRGLDHLLGPLRTESSCICHL